MDFERETKEIDKVKTEVGAHSLILNRVPKVSKHNCLGKNTVINSLVLLPTVSMAANGTAVVETTACSWSVN